MKRGVPLLMRWVAAVVDYNASAGRKGDYAEGVREQDDEEIGRVRECMEWSGFNSSGRTKSSTLDRIEELLLWVPHDCETEKMRACTMEVSSWLLGLGAALEA